MAGPYFAVNVPPFTSKFMLPMVLFPLSAAYCEMISPPFTTTVAPLYAATPYPEADVSVDSIVPLFNVTFAASPSAETEPFFITSLPFFDELSMLSVPSTSTGSFGSVNVSVFPARSNARFSPASTFNSSDSVLSANNVTFSPDFFAAATASANVS